MNVHGCITEEYKKKQEESRATDSKSMSSLKWSTAQLKKVKSFPLTLCILMNSSFWFDIIILGSPIIYIYIYI